MMIKLKPSLHFVLFLVLVWALPACNGSVEQEKEGFYQGKIKVGHLVALDMAPLFVAKEKGYFKEEGLDVETVFFSNPGDNNCSHTCPRRDRVLLDMERELSDKERGLLKVSLDNGAYYRADELYREVELVLEATCTACSAGGR